MDEVLEEQQRLYGATVGESVTRITAGLSLSQAAVARVLGVSAPMLSQVVNGHRVKFANPLTVQRLRSLLDLTEQVESGLDREAITPRLAEIADSGATTLVPTRVRQEPAEVAAAVSSVLRAVASGRELEAAAAEMRHRFPTIAEVLRVYGTGTPAAAAAHAAALRRLL